MRSIPVQEKPSRSVKIAVATLGAAALATMAVGRGEFHSTPKPQEHSISYLNNDEMQNGIIVKEGDTPEGIAKSVNREDRLTGQALLDAENFVAHEGDATGVTSSGATHYDLQPGQQVEVPIMPDQQIKDVNSGKIK